MMHVVRDPSGRIVARARGAVAAHRASRRRHGGRVEPANRARAIRLDEEGLIDASIRIADLVRAAAAKLPPGQPVGGRLIIDPRDRGYVRIRTVRGEVDRVKFHVYSTPPARGKEFRSGKSVVGGHLEIMLDRPREIVVLLNGSMTPEQIRDAAVEDDVLHLLSHETTHAAEARYIRKIGEGGREGSYVYDAKVVGEYARDLFLDPYDLSEEVAKNVVYYNHPAEVRAYGQEVVREALAGISRTARVSDRLIERFLSVRSPTWQRIEVHLTERNKNRIRLMVWRALEERGGANRAGGASTFGDYRFTADRDMWSVDAYLGDTWVGTAEFSEVRGPVALKGWNVEVIPEHRRKGLASAMYRFAEKEFGVPIVAGDFQTPMGAEFLANRGRKE